MKEIGTHTLYYYLRWQMFDKVNNKGLAYWKMNGKFIPRPNTDLLRERYYAAVKFNAI